MIKRSKSSNLGITLIALVVTIIVLMILAGIAVAALMGDNGIIKRAGEAKESQRGATVQDEVTLALSENKMIDEINKTKGVTGGLKTKETLVNELVDKGYLTNDDKTTLETEDEITIGSITIDFSALGNTSSNLTLGATYDSGDLKIGDKLTYSSNGQSNWIVFGKDTTGNILITTELPIDNAFSLRVGAESWLKYESYTDTQYGLNSACTCYGGTIQGRDVISRSINMEDINYVAGLTCKTITDNGNTYNIQSFDTYTFGNNAYNVANKTTNCWYPVLTGGTGSLGNGSGFWKQPTDEHEEAFKNNLYTYYYDWESGNSFYKGEDTNGNYVDATSVDLNTDNLKYIWGGNTTTTCYNYYVVASRYVSISSTNAYFGVIFAGGTQGRNNISSFTMCSSSPENGNDGGIGGPMGIRPIVILPPDLLVEEQIGGTYDLAE